MICPIGAFSPINANIAFLTNEVYEWLSGGFQPNANGWPAGALNALPNLPHFTLLTTNRLQAFILATDKNGAQRVIDYVHFNGPDSQRDLNAEIQTTLKKSSYDNMWDTNKNTRGVPYGIVSQIDASLGTLGLSTLYWNDLNLAKVECDGFAVFMNQSPLFLPLPSGYANVYNYYTNSLTVQVPFSPTVTAYEYTTWQANDPLIRTTLQNNMAKTNPQSFSRPPMERMMRFHDLLKEQSYPNCNQVAKEFEVSWRTIMRDVDFMKCRLNLPMEFDSRRNGYYYTKPVDQFPHLPLSESEVFALLVASKAIAQYRGTPFEQPLALAFKRLTGQLDSETRFSLGSLDEALSFRPFAPEDTDLKTFEVLTRALKERRVLKFQYRNLDAEKAQSRLVNPYHLGCIDNHWYLFAFDVKREAMRTFALPRLKSPELTTERFNIPKKFNLAEHLKGSLGVFKGDADYEIVVDFDSWGADLIRGRKWHASQEITELPNDGEQCRSRANHPKVTIPRP